MRQFESWKACWAAGVLVSFATGTMAGPPSGTAFTYQAQLKYNGSPVTDNCDIELGLFDTEFDGVALATDTFYKVAVVNGLFTVRPDFGPDRFDGSPKYLEVTVSCSAVQSVTLSPRHEITPTPESTFSQTTRGITVDESGRVGIGIDTPSAALHLRNQEIDVALKMRASGSWTAELRQTNASLLSLVNGGSERLTILPNGRVGIGTLNPDAKLDVTGSIKLSGDVIIPPTTRYLMISAMDFAAQSSSMEVFRQWTEIDASFMPAGQQTFLFAPVHLPHGAVVTEVSAELFDVAPNNAISAALQGRDSDLNQIVLASITTQGTPGVVQWHATSIANSVIDNTAYAYYVVVAFSVPESGSGNLKIKPVRITYEVTSPLP